MTLFVETAACADSFMPGRGRRNREQNPKQTDHNHNHRAGNMPEESRSSSNAAESPRKRKRSKKSEVEKKFECKHEGCGKSYSRAEHLYRHQLNRTRFYSTRHVIRIDLYKWR